ncbi:glycosyltransferase [Flavobacterium sp. M31R6]|uniref:glycosyltransferase n=1 Tax=Flavobacterium sp. M31R6 TaxID=2739062 RepID=UPI001567F37D|nr:glycosyltransferase [Flavobacterium sp. M31R6]QKJ64820.1 glycosyltransferase [Flavobacterium sp. M31R6]
MKILLLSNANSIHTKRWATSLAQRNIEICLFSLEKNEDMEYEKFSNIIIIDGGFQNNSSKDGEISKITLIQYLPKLLKVIKNFKPDIVHAHYATSYGLLGALCGFKPFILSVWGSDIYDFPKISFIHKLMIKFNLYRADEILSTSHVMALETNKYTKKRIHITPFGIDLSKFRKIETNSFFSSEAIVIGTVKTLSSKYGIDYLIKAFKIVKEDNPSLQLKLMIVGEGEDKTKLVNLCENLDILNDVNFVGKVENYLVPNYINMMDIYVALSNSESFGVAIIEASACEKPVVVSNVGGLPEVVANNETGFVVESKNPQEAAYTIEKLILDKSLRITMGKAGRERVKKLYDWEDNVDLVIGIYSKVNLNSMNS